MMGLYLGIEGESYFVFDESGIKIFLDDYSRR